jgi:flagellar L-ring protein precursor FlgH
MHRFWQIFMTCSLAATGAAAGAASLYNQDTHRPLIADQRARIPGDLLTVVVYETSSASTTTDSSLQHRSALTAELQLPTHGGVANAALGSTFNGGGTVQRAGKVLAQLSVRVTGTDPNGDLLVAGEQDLLINSDRQHIRIEGRVRRADIAADNTVQSHRLADARISYVGDGDLAQHQRPGMLARILLWLGL